MTMTKVEIDVPEGIVPYTVPEDKEAQITRNAMLVYPYIKSGAISHGIPETVFRELTENKAYLEEA